MLRRTNAKAAGAATLVFITSAFRNGAAAIPRTEPFSHKLKDLGFVHTVRSRSATFEYAGIH